MRAADDEEDQSTASNTTHPESVQPNMPAIAEESETEYPSFSQKLPKFGREDSEFDQVIDSVLAQNRDKSPMRRDDLSDDSDISPSAAGGNPLKDFTFVGGGGGFDLKPRKPEKVPDSITAIRDYLEGELGERRLYQAYPILRDFGDDILFEEKTAELIEKLAHIMSETELHKYRNFFSLLVIHDTQVEQNGGGEDAMLQAA